MSFRLLRSCGPAAALLLAVVAVLLARTAPAHATASPSLAVGIADDKTEMFTDPYFLQLGVKKVRRVVPWDAMSVDFERPEVDDWIKAALAAKQRPLISFGHSRREGQRRVAPTVAKYVGEFKKFRTRYPELKEFAVWNEPNLCGEPLCHKPQLAARYYDALVTACPSCTILASEVLDGSTMRSWVTAFLKAVKHQPKIWGLHNYVDANRLQTTGTRKLLGLVKGQIWFTETGGIVKRRTTNKVGGFPETVAHAGLALRWIFDRLVPLSPRITRVYIYHWIPSTPTDSWDSALLDVNGQPRTAWRVLRNRLQALAASRRATAARRARAR
jgi:hypothetical protein